MVIDKMGLELEGAWKGEPRVRPFMDAKIKHDGSVHFNQQGADYLHYGEIVSEPMEPGELAEWGVVHCPTHANDSAGTHLHVSLKRKSMYAALLTPSFSKTLMRAYEKYNEQFKESDPETYERFRKRLGGKNRYCKSGFKGLSQIMMDSRGPERYHQVNYCYKLHGTLEIRVLPCTNNSEFIKGVVLLTRDIIEDFVAREHVSKKIRFRRA